MLTASTISIQWRLAVAAALATLVACADTRTLPVPPASGDRAGPVVGRGAGALSAVPEMAVTADALAPSAGMLAERKTAGNAASGYPALPAATATPNMIIRNGNASVLVDSLEPAIQQVTALATRMGGFVANTHIQSGESQVPSATIEVKIPSERFEQASNELSALGKVEFVSKTAEDVGEEFVDITARVTNARHLEDRLVDLLARRTGKLEEVLAVERELARVREEIERYEGRLRFLKTRVATSTLSITVHEKAPIVSSNPGENVLGAAALDAWRNFMNFLAAFIASLGWLVPLGGIALAGVLGGRRLLRRRARAASSVGEEQG